MDKIQVIIPTTPGRERYLHWCIVSCLAQQDPCFGVLVSSNGKSPEVRRIVESFGDSRLQLVEPEDFLPMAMHWEFALGRASGQVITFIGDDDALMPGCLAKVRALLADNPDIPCVTHSPAQYYWPDYPMDHQRNRFWAVRGSGLSRAVRAVAALDAVMAFKAHYSTLPYLYHGFIKTEVLERVRRDRGTIFKRSCPDIYSDFILALYCESFLRFDGVLTIGGQGAKSTGVNYLLDKAFAESFLQTLPLEMRSKYSTKSATVEVFEYIELVRSLRQSSPSRAGAHVRLLVAAFRDAMSNAAYRQDILSDITRISREHFPWYLKMVATALVVAGSTVTISRLLQGLLAVRQRRIMARRYRNAATAYGAQNVWELAQALAGEQVWSAP
jgi:hypothetical protein